MVVIYQFLNLMIFYSKEMKAKILIIFINLLKIVEIKFLIFQVNLVIFFFRWY